MKDQFKTRQFGLSLEMQKIIESYLIEEKLWGQWHRIANHINKVSDHFIHRRGVTPWDDPLDRAAYLLYFLPLNVARVSAVWETVIKTDFPIQKEVIDFGSGPGTSFWCLPESLKINHWINWESSVAAMDLHQKLQKTHPSVHLKKVDCRWQRDKPVLKGKTLIASYSLNELETWSSLGDEVQSLILIEPSVQEVGRQLMELRQELIKRDFLIWAPCTHQGECPLLKESKRDWCHDRIFFKAPFWWQEIQNLLPMKNDSVTFSYLLAARRGSVAQLQKASPGHQLARVIGDTLFEKGKVRQAICRKSEREFLSWLKKEGDLPMIPRGSLIELPEQIEKKGNEIRGY